ncbi:MAG: response regulator [Bacteroidia bacterium]
MDALKKCRILLVDDHRILLEGIKTLLSAEPDFDVVGEAENARMALRLLGFVEADLLITDLSLPDTKGTQFLQEVIEQFPKLKIVVLSMHDEAEVIKDVLQLAVHAYVLKSNSKDELLKAIWAVMQNEKYISPDANIKLLETQQRNQASQLTEREIEIVKLISQEYSNKQIADKLFISERTVESHRKNIFRKAGAHSVVGVMKYALEHKII